jgi:hypothetical protein
MGSHWTIAAAGIGLALGLSVAATGQVLDSPSSHALTFFGPIFRGDPGSTLRALRPPAASVMERARAIASLPEDDSVHDEVLDPELVWLTHEHEPWRPRTVQGTTPSLPEYGEYRPSRPAA